MTSAAPGRPSRETGLPPGVEVGPLGARFVAYLIDISVPAVVNGALGVLLPNSTGSLRTILVIVAGVVTVGWTLLLWFRLAGRAATPGLQAMKLQLVGFYDGRPIGLGRVFVRGLILWLLSVTGIGLLIMLILLILHPRHQGWHDRAVKAVLIKQRTLAPRPPAANTGASAVGASSGSAPAQLPPPQQRAGQPSGQPTPAAYGPGPGGYPPPGYQASPAGPYGAPSGPQQQPQPGQPPARLAPPPGYPQAQPGAYSPIPGAPLLPPPGSPESGPRPEPDLATSVTRPMSAVPSAASAPEPEWVAVLDDGRELTVDGLVLIGRNPQPQPGEEDAQLIKIADETRTVSKSHLAIGLDANGLFVVDRGSTNGSTVTTPDGVSSRCSAGDVIYVAAGSIVSIGDHWLEIRRG